MELQVLLIPLIAALVIGLLIFGWWREKKRREAFEALARRLGMSYMRKDRGLAGAYGFLNRAAQGSNRYAFNILRGEYDGRPVCLFDYHYETYSTDSKGRRKTHHHYLSFFVLHDTATYPELTIVREGFFDKIGQAIGFDDIDFESSEFSKAFAVRSKDKKFAYDICHTRMMEYLLQNRDLSIEVEANCVSLSFTSRVDPDDVERRLGQLVAVRDLFPEYLYRD
jgi:hypothetical protein